MTWTGGEVFQQPVNRMKHEEVAAAPPPTAEDVLLLREIRDALRK